jgi:hypothetical protein
LVTSAFNDIVSPKKLEQVNLPNSAVPAKIQKFLGMKERTKTISFIGLVIQRKKGFRKIAHDPQEQH